MHDQVHRLIERLGALADRPVASLVRFDRGAQSVNYAGHWKDGGRFVLKLVPFSRADQYERLVEHLEKAASPVVRELEPRLRFDIDGFHALLLVWCEGETVTFDRLFNRTTPERFLADYARFSQAIQTNVKLYPQMPSGEAALEVGRIVIHGDFQSDNLRFVDGALRHVLDIEEFRLGRPVEDFVRYAACSFGHLPFFAWRRRARIIRSLVALAAASGYSADEWRAAIRASCAERFRKPRRFGRFRWRTFYAALEKGVCG